MPTLQQLLNFFRDHALPPDVEAVYRQTTVAGLPVCNDDDGGIPGDHEELPQRHRLLGYADNPNNALFLPTIQVTASALFNAPDDVLVRRLLSATNGLRYEDLLRNGDVASSVLSLCRDASPLSGTGAQAAYAVYAARNTILNHRNPGVPGLVPLSVRLTPSEIVAIVSGLRTSGGETFRLPEEHYAVNPSDQGQLSLFPNATEIRDMIAMIQSERSPIAPDRRAVITTALHHVIDNGPANPAVLRRVDFTFRGSEIETLVNGLRRPDGTLHSIPRDHYLVDPADRSQLSLLPDRNEVERLVTLIERPDSPITAARRAPMAAALRDCIRAEATQAHVVEEQDRWPPWKIALYTLLGSVIPSIGIMFWMQRRNEALMREMQQGPRVNTAELFKDPTVSMRTREAIAIPDSQRRYVEAVRSRFNQGQFAHVVLSGPSGSGKSFTADLIGRLAVNGQLGVTGFTGQDVHFVRIDANEIIRSAGAWQNGAQSRFFEVLNQLTRDHSGPLIIHLLEADKYAAAGQGPGNQPLNLLKELYTIMEGVNPQYRNVHFILDSTRWQIVRDAAPDMLRRAQFMEIIPTMPEDLRNAIESGVRSRRTSHPDDRIRERFERITFSPEALDAIAAMGEYRNGAPPSSHLSMIDQLAEEASQHTGGRMTITADHVLRLVARDRAAPIAQIREEFASRMGTEGVRQNPRIQAAILAGFYREYPEPMRGRVNPMDLAAVADANPASLFADAPAPPQTDFTEAHFAELIADRFPQFKNAEGHIHGHFRGFISVMARMARNEWVRRGQPTVRVGALTIPNEAVVVELAERLVRQAESENREQGDQLRRIYEARAESLERRGETAAREAFRRMETIGR